MDIDFGILKNIFTKKEDIKDNLTSTDTDKPLSAKQGKELKTLIDAKPNLGTTSTTAAAGNHNHDSRYFFQDSIDIAFQQADLFLDSSTQQFWEQNGILKTIESQGYDSIEEFLGDIIPEYDFAKGAIISIESPFAINEDYDNINFVCIMTNEEFSQGTYYSLHVIYNPEIQYKETTITYDDDTTKTVYLMTL